LQLAIPSRDFTFGEVVLHPPVKTGSDYIQTLSGQ
jgi:hypothetical protein